MTYLYGGNILRIDLGSGEIEKQPTTAYAEKWLGGRGFDRRVGQESRGREIVRSWH